MWNKSTWPNYEILFCASLPNCSKFCKNKIKLCAHFARFVLENSSEETKKYLLYSLSLSLSPFQRFSRPNIKRYKIYRFFHKKYFFLPCARVKIKLIKIDVHKSFRNEKKTRKEIILHSFSAVYFFSQSPCYFYNG